MSVFKNVLKDPKVREEVILLASQGMASREIATMVGSSKSAVGDLLRGTTHAAWVTEYEAAQQLVTELEEEEPMQEEEGGIDELCESPDHDVASLAKRLRTAQKANSQLRRAINGAADTTSHIPDMVKAIELATKRINNSPITNWELTDVGNGNTPAIYEILLSDYQIGKVGQHYNSKLAEKAMKKMGDEVLQKLITSTELYDPKKIILASLGDIVEDHLKHGVQSAVSTDCGLSEQMALATEHLWSYIVKPLAETLVPMEVICIAGNHGSSEHKGMDMYKAGLYSYDYAIYKALEGYCRVAGYSHVKFVIPEGCFGYTEIFGRYAVYEHGYFNTCTEKSLEDQRNKRSNQLKRHIEYFRCGDMHHLCNFDNGRLVVNGAFFGVDTEGVEYSGILGFSSVPAQLMMIHTDDSSLGRNTVKETHVIQVADGY